MKTATCEKSILDSLDAQINDWLSREDYEFCLREALETWSNDASLANRVDLLAAIAEELGCGVTVDHEDSPSVAYVTGEVLNTTVTVVRQPEDESGGWSKNIIVTDMTKSEEG